MMIPSLKNIVLDRAAPAGVTHYSRETVYRSGPELLIAVEGRTASWETAGRGRAEIAVRACGPGGLDLSVVEIGRKTRRATSLSVSRESAAAIGAFIVDQFSLDLVAAAIRLADLVEAQALGDQAPEHLRGVTDADVAAAVNDLRVQTSARGSAA